LLQRPPSTQDNVSSQPSGLVQGVEVERERGRELKGKSSPRRRKKKRPINPISGGKSPSAEGRGNPECPVLVLRKNPEGQLEGNRGALESSKVPWPGTETAIKGAQETANTDPPRKVRFFST